MLANKNAALPYIVFPSTWMLIWLQWHGINSMNGIMFREVPFLMYLRLVLPWIAILAALLFAIYVILHVKKSTFMATLNYVVLVFFIALALLAQCVWISQSSSYLVEMRQ